MMRLACFLSAAALVCLAQAQNPFLSEVYLDPAGADAGWEAIEVQGPPSTSASGWTIVQIEGDSGQNPGEIDSAIALSGSFGSNGLLLLRESTNVHDPAPGGPTTVVDNAFSTNLENGTSTLVLVSGYTGTLGADLDTNDDGNPDGSMPWSNLVDAISWTDGGASDQEYGYAYNGFEFPALAFSPGLLYRILGVGEAFPVRWAAWPSVSSNQARAEVGTLAWGIAPRLSALLTVDEVTNHSLGRKNTVYSELPTSIAIRGVANQLGYYTTSNGALTGTRTVGTYPPATWTVRGFADVNFNGRTDVMVQAPGSTVINAYLMDDHTVMGWATVGTVPAGWAFLGMMDVTYDFIPDMLVQRTSDRRLGAYVRSPIGVVGWRSIYTVPPAGYVYVGTLDISNELLNDILWFDTSSRRLIVWRMSGALYLGTEVITRVAAGWVPAGIMDLNNDLVPDVVIYNPTTRSFGGWTLNGTAVTGWKTVMTIPAGWTPQGTTRQR